MATGAPAAEGEASTLLFGSLDAAASTFATAGAKIALDRLDRPGFVALASAGIGRRVERSSCTCDTRAGVASLARHTFLGSALVGYQWFADWGVVAAYAGVEGSREAILDGNTLYVFPGRTGLRLHGEVWARPSTDTLLAATAILGSARGDAWTRIALGYRLWDTYLGPEVGLYADRTGYRKWSIGLHGTDFAIGRFGLRASAGFQFESSGGAGSPYVAVSAWTDL
ncbi:cellulose biosynthesis protein BcsS [Methylobacterium planeticum]|uniref:Cellulose biosynthesis protein BcsS n=2 Tax=Methylobacterium planeticum TaxID=2615211 RepID=A0A6N6MW29_9HYPH|nr:cellulose biosynthesis protein BcsS [Methylobacterium planeticum]